jgi:hypothetical protein
MPGTTENFKDQPIVEKPLDWFIPAKYNPRKDLQPGDPEYESLKRSVMKFGHVQILVANKNGTLIGGHQTLKVLRDIGRKRARCVILDLPPGEEKILNIALNQIEGDWDYGRLQDILLGLKEQSAELSLTGFENSEIDKILSWAQNSKPDDIGKTTDQELETFLNTNIRQIVLYFEQKSYEDVLRRLEIVLKNEELKNNTEAFLFLLRKYEESINEAA